MSSDGSPKPSSPPPAYTELDPSNPFSEPSSSSSSTPPPHSQPHFSGPTPQTQLLPTHVPYYDPQSTYSVAEAAGRARWRFLVALMWAVGILLVVSVVMGMEVLIVERPVDPWPPVV